MSTASPALSATRGIAGFRIALQSLDIVSIASGGGSIARVDSGGILSVRPRKAPAPMPGPACYGQGGTEVTVTDASVVLGFLDPANFLGGRARLDQEAAETVLDRLAHRLSVSRAEAAQGVHRVINTQMAEGIRLVSVRRGVDPRRFALLSFGGAAGIHITDIARQIDVPRVVVPRAAAVLSAWGMLATDLRFEISRTHVGDTRMLEADAIRDLYASMEQEGRSRLARVFDGEVAVRRSADMRYGEQIFEIDVPLDGVDFAGTGLIEDITRRFHRRHEDLFTYSLPDQESVLVNARLAAIGRLPVLPQEPEVRDREPARAPGHAAGLPRWLAGPPRFRPRDPLSRSGDEGSGDHRIRHHHRGAARRRQRGPERRALARHHHREVNRPVTARSRA